MNNKYILISLEDSKARKVADILGNRTSKRVLDFLAETKEASVSDIANALDMPLNTIGYNVQKLVDVGLAEKSKNYFWSVKGKKIDMYRASNKSIIISPKSRIASGLKSVLPVALISGLFALLIRNFYSGARFAATKHLAEEVLPTAEQMPVVAVQPIFASAWVWFLGGVLFALVIYLTLNWILNLRKLR